MGRIEIVNQNWWRLLLVLRLIVCLISVIISQCLNFTHTSHVIHLIKQKIGSHFNFQSRSNHVRTCKYVFVHSFIHQNSNSWSERIRREKTKVRKRKSVFELKIAREKNRTHIEIWLWRKMIWRFFATVCKFCEAKQKLIPWRNTGADHKQPRSMNNYSFYALL